MRRYCDAAEARYGDRAATMEWLDWARGYADRRDPLTDPPSMPEPLDATAEAPEEYLPRDWSTHGPGHGAPRGLRSPRPIP